MNPSKIHAFIRKLLAIQAKPNNNDPCYYGNENVGILMQHYSQFIYYKSYGQNSCTKY